MLDNIYLDKSLQNRSTSSATRYKNKDGYVTVGGTCEGHLPRTPMIVIHLIGLDVYGGPKEVEEWQKLTQDSEKTAFMWKCLFKGLNPKLLKAIILHAEDIGKSKGRNTLRKEIRELFTDEYEF